MKNSYILALFFSIFVIFLSSFTSANILLSGMTGTYSLGDTINLEARVSQPTDFNGFFRIVLVCDSLSNSSQSMMYFSPIELDKNKEKTITVNFPVTKTGSCYILAVLENNNNVEIEEAKTSGLLLSSNIKVSAAPNQNVFFPSETLEIAGTAIKDNSQNYDGSAILVFEGQENVIDISNGKFSFSQKLSDTIAPGEHNILVKVEDSNSNFGYSNITFKVAAIPTTLIIETNNDEVMPGSLLMITPKMLDQANNTMDAGIILTISQLNTFIITQKKILMQEILDSGNNTLYHLEPYAEPGEYIIEANTEVQNKEFSAKKTFTVPKFEDINITINGNIATIANIGNIPYKKQIEFEFIIQGQSTKKVLDIDLGIGETKEYRLEAPEGNYNLIINKGNNKLNFTNVPLTGSVVATVDIGQEKQSNTNWTVAIIILALLAVLIISWFMIRKQKREVYYGAINNYSSQQKESQKQGQSTAQSLIPETTKQKQETKQKLELKGNEKQVIDNFASMYTDDTIKKIFKKNAASKLSAHSVIPTLVYGTKQEITVLVLSILGFERLQAIKNKDKALYESILNEYFSAVINSVKSQHGVADIYGNNIVVIFNVIKQYRHDVAAVKVAQEIRNTTNALNTKLIQQDISLAVKAGINTGMAIVSSIGADKEVKYTSIGNTTTFARLLERKAVANEILLTDNIYNRVSNVIKGRKISPLHTSDAEAIDVYSVTEGTNTEMKDRHKWYVDRALKG